MDLGCQVKKSSLNSHLQDAMKVLQCTSKHIEGRFASNYLQNIAKVYFLLHKFIALNFYCPQRKLPESNVFTGILSVHRDGGGLLTSGSQPGHQTWAPRRVTSGGGHCSILLECFLYILCG